MVNLVVRSSWYWYGRNFASSSSKYKSVSYTHLDVYKRQVIVLGHTDYYPRFGFRPAPPLGIRWEHGADAHFMVQELQPRALDGASGVVRYRPEFDNV